MTTIYPESSPSSICPVTALPITTRPEWTDIDVAKNYSVSFSLIGNAILCTVPNGIPSDRGTRKILESRKRVLKEVSLLDKRYAEIRDYSRLAGRPPKESRLMLTNLLLKETNEGNLLGFWVFNAPLFIRWFLNVGTKLHKSSVPVSAVKDYREAVENAVNMLHENGVNVGARRYKRFTKDDWCLELGDFRVQFELIADDIIYTSAQGSMKEDYVENYFKFNKKVLDEAGLMEKECYYRILNWEKLEKTTWKARRMYIDGLRDFNKKAPSRLSVLFGLNKYMRTIFRISKQFAPGPVTTARNLEEALTIIEEEKNRGTGTKNTVKERTLPAKTFTEGQVRKYSTELLQFLGTINWDQQGVSPEDISDSHPFKHVFDAMAIIKGDLDDLFQKHMEAEKALRESEAKYRTILESIEDGYYEVDTAGNLLFFNDSMCRILGYTRDELTGMNYRKYMDKENADAVYKTFNRVYRTGVPDKGFDWEISRKDGKKRFIESSLTLMRNAEGQRIGFRGILRDVTERNRMETQLMQAQRMEAIGTLAGGVAHDLNNVLSGLVSFPELLLMELPEDSPLRGPVATIQKSGEKAAAIVQDLLTLARRGVPVDEVVNLGIIVAEYLMSPEYEKLKSFHPKIEMATHFERGLLNIVGSPIHLSKTVMNLVSNAAEAMPDGGKIIISTENRYIDSPIRGYDSIKEGDYVVLKVEDKGTGIPPEDLDKIFEPFYTKKKMGRSGTGLGMAVVWGAVKDHNGYIDIQTGQGKGTTFTLYFPVTRKEMIDKISTGTIESYMGEGSILVVDDVKEQREIAEHMLTKLGYNVAIVSSGEEAVEYMKKNKADLMVLDMIMDPGIDGLDTYARIIEIHPNQKAVIASGFSETGRVKEAQKLGANQYIKKPYTLEKIGLAVKAELEKSFI